MTNLLVLKEQLREFYSRYEAYVRPLIKFIIALLVLMIINSRLGFDPRLTSMALVVILSAVCAVLPGGAITVVAGILAVGQVFMVSPIMAGVILIIYIIMYCLAIRYAKGLVNIILAIPILYVLKIPYVIPILMGMITTPIAALPTSCGVIMYYLFMAVKNSATAIAATSMEDSLGLYKQVVDTAMGKYELVFSVILFVTALLVTYYIRKSTIDHAFEAANAAGTVVCVLGVLVGKLGFDISGNTLVLVLGSVVSGVIVYVICYFRMTLDYSATEHLQFEDDDYYYYVKAVPKMKMTAPEKNVKRINPQKVTGNTQNLQAVQETLKNGDDDTEYFGKAVENDLYREIEDSEISKFDI